MHQACQALDGSELLKRALNLRPMGMEQGPAAQSVATCWFCLSNEQSDKRLVLSIGAQSAANHLLIHPLCVACLMQPTA